MYASTQGKHFARDMPAADGPSRSATRGLYDIGYDEQSGIILTKVRGVWSPRETNEYFDRLERYLELRRRQCAPLRLLVDRRGSPAQPHEVAMRLKVANERLYRAADRVAIVVDSSLLKMQLRRLITREGSKAFLSYDAAVTWLQAYR